MSQVIRITINLYNRLSAHANGFDTPANVIENILDYYEKHKGFNSSQSLSLHPTKQPTHLEIVYYPENEQSFKELLLQTKKAYIFLYKQDGTTEIKEWNANNFDKNSKVNGNLRSGQLRGWKSKGIYKAEVSTNIEDLKP